VRVHLGAFLDAEDRLYVGRAERDRWVLRAALVAVLVELAALLVALALLRRRAVGQARGLAAQQYQLEEQAVELEQQTEESVELARNLETANAALRESEERTRLMIEGVRDYAIVRLDPSGVVMSWNAGAAQLHGYEPDEIVGRHGATFSLPEDVEAGRPRRALEAAARDGRFEEEGWQLRKDGGRFWASVLVAPLRDAHGRLLGFVQVTRDLTERRQAELALREQYELLRTVLAATGDLVFAKDLDGRYLVANEAVARVHGRPAAEIVGRSDAELFGPSARPSCAPPTRARWPAAPRSGWRRRRWWRASGGPSGARARCCGTPPGAPPAWSASRWTSPTRSAPPRRWCRRTASSRRPPTPSPTTCARRCGRSTASAASSRSTTASGSTPRGWRCSGGSAATASAWAS
jgi:PAS domain S-box-containing protein